MSAQPPQTQPRASDSLRCHLVDDLDDALGLASEWDALADVTGAGLHARPGYALGWWRHLGKGRLLVVVVRQEGRIVALAPLHERRVGPVRVARWLGHGLGSVCEALVSPGHDDAARLMWSSVARGGRVLELVETRAGGGGLAELVELPMRGRRTQVVPRDVCPVADLGDDPDGLHVLRRPEAKNLRHAMKKADKALVRTGVRFDVRAAEDVATFEEMLPAILAVFDAAEADRPRQHLLRPPYEAFMLEQIRTDLGAGRAVVLGGYLDERLVTFRVAHMRGDTMWLSLGRFAPDVAAFRPGHLLYRETYRWAAEKGIKRIDQLLGDSQTKRQWATGAYETLEVVNGSAAAVRFVKTAERLAGAIPRGGA